LVTVSILIMHPLIFKRREFKATKDWNKRGIFRGEKGLFGEREEVKVDFEEFMEDTSPFL